MGKTISVSVASEVDIDVDYILTKISTDALCEELSARCLRLIQNTASRYTMTKEEKEKITDDLQELIDQLGLSTGVELPYKFNIMSIADQLKIMHLQDVFDKYSCEEIEKALPNI